ncbi:MAG: serine hydrolase, partial [Planctomycetota bacterium]|nr:serine hydrolase [Planctomycetota bacterium]
MSPRLAPVVAAFLVACTAAPAPLHQRTWRSHLVAEVDDPALAERLEQLCEKLEEERLELHIPGMALAVVMDDEIVLARGFGLADLEDGEPATPETLFAIGSSTKAFTAAVIGMLVDEGKMEWDDPIVDHLPYFTPELDTEDEDAVLTVRDTLCHDSGFARMDILWGAGMASREEILRTASGAQAWEGFREGFNYNNIMFLAAGEASAAAAGKGWDALVEERLFDPLGMSSTNTSVVESQTDPRLALGYRWDEDAGEHVHLPMRVLDSIAPAGAINSNVLDMAQWLRFQLGGGVYEGERLISEDQVRETRTDQIGPGPDYGLGWFLGDWNGQPVVQHGGNIDGFGAQVAFLPESSLGYVLLTNVTSTPLQGGSMQIVWETLLGGEEATDALDFDRYVGNYIGDFGAWKEATFEVLVKDERLAVDVPGQIVYTLHPPDDEGKWFFTLTDAIAVSFERDADGAVQVMHMHQGGLEFELPREEYEFPLEIDLDEVQRYLGRYRDDLLGEELTVLVDKNRLAVDIPKQMVCHLRLPDEDGWWWFR